MLISAASTKGRPFKGKCSSYRKFEFLEGNEIPLSDFFSSRKRKPDRVAASILLSVALIKKYSLKLAIMSLKLNIWINTCKDVHFW